MDNIKDLKSTMLVVGLSARDRFYVYDRFSKDLSIYPFRYSSFYSNIHRKPREEQDHIKNIFVFNYRKEFLRSFTLYLN